MRNNDAIDGTAPHRSSHSRQTPEGAVASSGRKCSCTSTQARQLPYPLTQALKRREHLQHDLGEVSRSRAPRHSKTAVMPCAHAVKATSCNGKIAPAHSAGGWYSCRSDLPQRSVPTGTAFCAEPSPAQEPRPLNDIYCTAPARCGMVRAHNALGAGEHNPLHVAFMLRPPLCRTRLAA